MNSEATSCVVGLERKGPVIGPAFVFVVLEDAECMYSP